MDELELKGVRFLPWIGERFNGENRFGVRVLVLGEAHYGETGKEDPTETAGVVRRATQLPREGKGRRQRFFTVIANVLRGQRDGIDNSDLAEVFQEIAFYNFVQEFVGDSSRIAPASQQWDDAQAPFKTVLGKLQPDAVLVLGLRLSSHIIDWPHHIEHTVIKHPSSSMRYDEAIPKFENLVERAKGRLANSPRKPN